MMAHGETLGVLHLQGSPSGTGEPNREEYLAESCQQLALALAEQASLALANIRLRESLRKQSVRDPLTGLFNRRYMEESLQRELRRAVRGGLCVGVILVDLDHFKRFNDSFGHRAGDYLLHELGVFLMTHIRGEDVACRYGGEEFLLILPGATLDDTRLRAEQLHQAARQLRVEHGRHSLPAVTLSLGVAACPANGLTVEAVLGAADLAMYRAKAAGRDQVAVAPPAVPGRAASEQEDPQAPRQHNNQPLRHSHLVLEKQQPEEPAAAEAARSRPLPERPKDG
jgi:diguanylate cyclase (GGDEF)-like protein